MKKSGFSVVLLLSFCAVFNSNQIAAQGIFQFDQYFTDNTLHINYIHHGKAEKENIQFVEFKKQQKWAGSINNLISELNYGNFKVEIEDHESGMLIYRKGFSTLHNEWVNTAEAAKQCREFDEAVAIPFPKISIKIKIFSRDTNMVFKLLGECLFNPDLDKVTEIHPKYKTKVLQNNGDSHDKIDLVILAEGYKSNQKKLFYKDATRLVNELFSYQPFNQYRDMFNIVLVESWSEEKGTDFPHLNKYSNTAISTSFNTLGSERYLMAEDYWKLSDIAACAPYDHIIVLVNTKVYGGGGIYNFYATCAAGNENSGFVFCHEFGHSFAGLADEYTGNSTSVFDYKKIFEPWEPNITTLVSFDLKWKDMVLNSTPIPTKEELSYSKPKLIGAFEGAAYLEKDIYRPCYDCTMRSISENNFCPVCQKAIIKMIDYFTQ